MSIYRQFIANRTDLMDDSTYVKAFVELTQISCIIQRKIINTQKCPFAIGFADMTNKILLGFFNQALLKDNFVVLGTFWKPFVQLGEFGAERSHHRPPSHAKVEISIILFNKEYFSCKSIKRCYCVFFK